MATLPESPEDEELAEFLQRNVVDLEKGEVVKKVEEEVKEGECVKERSGGKKDEECEKEDEEEVNKEWEVKVEVKEEPNDWFEWNWYGEGIEEEAEADDDEAVIEEVPSPRTPAEESTEDDPWKKMGVNKAPDPPKVKTRGKGATKRHNSNFRQNQRNLAKRIMNQRHGSSSWWSSSSSWRGWQSWDDGWPSNSWSRGAWGHDHAASSSSATRLLEKALDKIPDAR